MVPVRSPAALPVVATLVLALLAGTEVAAEGPSICDSVTCGQGTCMETPGFLVPTFTTSFNCTCDPGATHILGIPILPCASPQCHFDASCFNVSLLPKGIPFPDLCGAINCGHGECKSEGLLSYSCECQPGYVNFLNLTALPCVNKCFFGVDCPTAPPPPSMALPPPSTAPPPGSVPSRRLLQLLLLLSLAMVQLV